MLTKEHILKLLNGMQEHKMAKDIFVPVLKKMGLQGVRFTGGNEEHGIDVEYYELTQPERHKSYVGIQFKKGDIFYSAKVNPNSIMEIRNQAEEAFGKEVFDIQDHGTYYICRFIVACTGDINDPARRMIGEARQKGKDRRIDYWTGELLAEFIQTDWMDEFEEYFDMGEKKADKIIETPLPNYNEKNIPPKILEKKEVIEKKHESIRGVHIADYKYIVSCPVADNDQVTFTIKFISDGNKSSTKIRVPDKRKPITIKDEGIDILGTGAVLRGYTLVSHTQVKNMIPDEEDITIEFRINNQIVMYNKKKSNIPNPHIMIEMRFPKPDVG